MKHRFIITIIVTVAALSHMMLFANIVSSTGEIEFDVNNNDSSELILTQTGLGLGVSPSTNLHVSGNTIISSDLYIGGMSGSSSLNVNGTMGYDIQFVDQNLTLENNSTVFVDSSSGNVNLLLPYAGNVKGRVYKIKKQYLVNRVLISGDNLIDTNWYYELSSGNTGAIELMSDGSKWYVLSSSTGASPYAWNPEFISAEVWYDSSDSSTVMAGATGNVYQWSDKSGNDIHATQTTSGSQPTTDSRTLNGLNVIDFATDFMSLNLDINRSTNPELSIFIVFAQDSTVGNYGLLGADNGGWDRLVLLNFDSSTGNEWGVSRASGTTAFEPTRTSDTSDHVLSILWNAGVASGSQVALDGATPTVFTEGLGTSGFTTTGIGSIRPTSHSPLDGYIAEMLFITSVVDDEMRQRIEGYLAWKWGLEANLPADHLYKSSAP